jgi:polyisoprenoid-binding protein YceI
MKYRLLIIPALILSFALPAQAAEYSFDASHTNLDWRINHFGFSNPSGKFARIEGTLSLDETKPEDSKVNVTIQIANLVTGIDKLDEHLKSADFFDIKQFPTATFVSDKVDVTGKDTAKVHGTLTLHGVAKPIVLDVKLNKLALNMMNKKTAGFTIHTTLKRSDFGMDKYLPMLGDDVDIHIESEANLNDTFKTPVR